MKRKRWKKKWTKEEEEYLESAFGEISYELIGIRIGRSFEGVKAKCLRMGLGGFRDNASDIPFGDLYRALTGGRKLSFKTFIKRHPDFPHRTRKIIDGKLAMVNIKKFWAWFKLNPEVINIAKMEPLILGPEPDWIPAKREKDYKRSIMGQKKKWTDKDKEWLTQLAKSGRYTVEMLSKIMERTPTNILRMINNLRLGENIVHVKRRYWTNDEVEKLKQVIMEEDNTIDVALKVGLPWRRVVTKMLNLYHTTNVKQIREFIREGK